MNYHSEEDRKQKFHASVDYFKENIPADDIYFFAEQLHEASVELLKILHDVINIDEAVKTYPMLEPIVRNILTLEYAKMDGGKITLIIKDEFL